jgi:hypothetical protein
VKSRGFIPSLAAQFGRGLAALAQRLKTFAARPNSVELPRIIIVVEGQHDVEFLRRISGILHAADPTLPDLAAMEHRRELVFLPFGGDPRPWAFRLASLELAEFHIYDRDVPPATDSREQAADMVNCRPYCRAVLTSKRSLENYLDSDAIFEHRGIRIEPSDHDDLADRVAQHVYERQEKVVSWHELPARARKRCRDKAKRWLNTRAAERMTVQRLANRDPNQEIQAWLKTIAALANGAP